MPKKSKKIEVRGLVRVSSDIASRILTDKHPVEFKKAAEKLQFERDDCYYTTEASVHCNEQDFIMVKPLGCSYLSIGYCMKEPDIETQRSIRKIISEKYFWGQKQQKILVILGFFTIITIQNHHFSLYLLLLLIYIKWLSVILYFDLCKFL